LIAGAAVAQERANGRATLGAFFEYGDGDYDTHNSFTNAARVKGKGDADYAGVGVLGRFDFTGNAAGHPYLEATLRTGRVKVDFHSADLQDAWGRSARFKSKATYTGASLGAGYVWQVSEQARLTAYGKYLWTHENGDSVRLSTGDPVKFSAVDSHRLRLGARYSRNIGDNKAATAYAGLAWEHEFDGKAKARVYGYPIDAPELKGDSGLVELGFTMNPTAHKPLTLDLGLQGYAGKREGVTGTVKVNWRF
ncbi:MAG: autotransporter domain-containing protein, partial [Candidatus Accumulibacter sp.]|nr:autotransporter domain-containing protein [Accumulibacter sp.]